GVGVRDALLVVVEVDSRSSNSCSARAPACPRRQVAEPSPRSSRPGVGPALRAPRRLASRPSLLSAILAPPMSSSPCPRCRTAPARTMALDSAAAMASLGLASQVTEVSLGRDPGCTVAIDNPVVSARHARIGKNIHPPGLFVEDLGSTNGTYVNGQRITRQNIT